MSATQPRDPSTPVTVRVIRQACCAADDQVGPLEAHFLVEQGQPLSVLVERIAASRFLQFSSTHDRISGEVNGRDIVKMPAPGGGPAVYHVDPGTPVALVIGEQALFFGFRQRPGAPGTLT